jgi:hypothetical protein
VRGEVQGIDLRLGEIVSPGHVALLAGRGEPWRRVDQLLLPGPRQHGAQVLARLVRGAAGVRPRPRDGTVVDPVQERANVFPPQLLDRYAAAPLFPLTESR